MGPVYISTGDSCSVLASCLRKVSWWRRNFIVVGGGGGGGGSGGGGSSINVSVNVVFVCV